MRWTLPNILTLARICLTPVIALLPFIEGYWPKVIAFLIFLAAGASDVVDGYLARRRNEVSELGQLLDPVADKLLLFAMLIPIFWLTRHPTILYGIPWWGSLPVWVALLLVGREVLITAFRFFAQRRGVVIPAAAAAGPRPRAGGGRDTPTNHGRRSARREPRGRSRSPGPHRVRDHHRRPRTHAGRYDQDGRRGPARQAARARRSSARGSRGT